LIKFIFDNIFDNTGSKSRKSTANPPGAGGPETIYYRETLYVAFIAISGFTALGLALLWNRVKIN
jgi:hypothetical protein